MERDGKDNSLLLSDTLSRSLPLVCRDTWYEVGTSVVLIRARVQGFKVSCGFLDSYDDREGESLVGAIAASQAAASEAADGHVDWRLVRVFLVLRRRRRYDSSVVGGEDRVGYQVMGGG